MPRSCREAAILAPVLPGWLMPDRSPLMSAMNTGTPISENPSAIFCSVTVLPVPVAPVIRPCRLASAGSSRHSVAEWRGGRKGGGLFGVLGGGRGGKEKTRRQRAGEGRVGEE